MNVTAKEAARRIREHNKIHQRAEPRNSPIITEILETAAVLFEKIDEEEYQLVKHGRWIATNDENKKRCSECDIIHLIAQYPYGKANYCPNCGAKMDGDAK